MTKRSYKILPATQFKGFMRMGGSTIPCLVDLKDSDDSEIAYVVKPFTHKVNTTTFATSKEVFGSVLAKQFDLPIADFALADFTSDFLTNVVTQGDRKELFARDNNLKFASVYIAGAPIFNLQKNKGFLRDYDCARVFAFDCLCWNVDRGGFRDKPNLLIDDEDFLLIDHEQIFPFVDDSENFFRKVMNDFQKGASLYKYQQHLFFPVLKHLRPFQKQHLFDEFHEHLIKLNINELIRVGEQMDEDGIQTGNWFLMINYLRFIKENHTKFIALLKNFIH